MNNAHSDNVHDIASHQFGLVVIGTHCLHSYFCHSTCSATQPSRSWVFTSPVLRSQGLWVPGSQSTVPVFIVSPLWKHWPSRIDGLDNIGLEYLNNLWSPNYAILELINHYKEHQTSVFILCGITLKKNMPYMEFNSLVLTRPVWSYNYWFSRAQWQ